MSDQSSEEGFVLGSLCFFASLSGLWFCFSSLSCLTVVLETNSFCSEDENVFNFVETDLKTFFSLLVWR